MAHTGRIIGQAMAGLAGPEIAPLVGMGTGLIKLFNVPNSSTCACVKAHTQLYTVLSFKNSE